MYNTNNSSVVYEHIIPDLILNLQELINLKNDIVLKELSARIIILMISVTACFHSHLYAQGARILELDNEKAYRLIERFIETGKFSKLNSTKLPYRHSEVYTELQRLDIDNLSRIEKVWYNLLEEEILNIDEAKGKEYIIEPYVVTGAEINNSERKNNYRPTDDELHVWPFQDNGLFAEFGNFTVNMNLRFDIYYEFGPDGLDPTNRLYIRNEDSYLGYSSKYFTAYLGRFESNWGMYDKHSTLLTDNAPTFDQIYYTVGTERFSFTNLHGFLDNISGDNVFRGNSLNDPLAKRRFLSLKRIDWRVTDHLALSFREGILYSGMNVNAEPKYLVPGFMYFFLEAAEPKDQIENLFMGGNIWYSKNGITLNFDFMLDDLIQAKDAEERNNFSLVFNSKYMLPKQALSLSWDFELASYQSYNTDQIEGQYLYLNRGISTDFNDYIFTEAGVTYYADLTVKGLSIKPYIGLLRQGEQTINQEFRNAYPNGDSYELVLTGEVEKTNRFAIEAYYSPVNYFWVKLDIGYNSVENLRNISGRNRGRMVGMFELGFKYNFKNFW